MIDFLKVQEFMSSDEAKAALESEMLDIPNQIETEEEADDVLGKVLWAQKQIHDNKVRVNAKREDLMKRIDNYEHELNNSLESYVDWQQSRLEVYARNKLKNQKGVVKLFNGNLQLKKPTIKYEYTDPDSTIKWLKENNFTEYIRTKEELDKVPFKGKFKDTNESVTAMMFAGKNIPGVTLSLDKDPTFSFTATKTKGAPIPI